MRTTPILRRLAPLAATILFMSCHDATGPQAPPVRSLVVVSGDQQRAPAGSELPERLTVRVEDARGRPVPGYLVDFRVTAGNGTVSPGSVATDRGGTASARWTLGTAAADAQGVEARTLASGTGEPLVAAFRATAVAGPPHAIGAASPTALAAFAGTPVADAPSVRVTDAYGNPVADLEVAWSTGGDASVSAALATTDALGLARVAWTPGLRVDSAYSLAASAAVGTVTFTAVAAVPPTAVLEKTAGDGQTVAPGAPFSPLEITLRLADGRPLRGARVTWTARLQGEPLPGWLPGESSVTGADGTSALQPPPSATPMRPTVEASVPGVPPAVFSLTIRPRVARLLANTDPYPAWSVAGAGVRVWAQALDDRGAGVAGAVVTFTANAGGGHAQEGRVVADAYGRAETTWVLGTTAGVENALTVASEGVQVSVSTPPTRPGPTARMDVQPDTVRLRVGQLAHVEGKAWDVYGNPTCQSWIVVEGQPIRVDPWRFSIVGSPDVLAPRIFDYMNPFVFEGLAPGTVQVRGVCEGWADETVVIVQ